MEEMNTQPRPVSPRRRRKTKLQIFKEAYLPVIIAGAALLLILVFIIGAIVRSVDNSRREEQARKAAAQQQALEEQRLQEEADRLVKEASQLAAGYDYDGAIAVLERFSGNWNEYPQVRDTRSEYLQQKNELVVWDDPAKIPNYSLQMLIADPERAYNDDRFSYSFTRNFLTVDEFSRILEQLYESNYVLVSLEDIYATETAMDGTQVFVANEIYLPAGKQPFVLTQTNVNYHTYLTDGDGDKLPDGGGRGFASKLVFDSNGQLVNEYIDAQGNLHTGAYDMIPILNSFIEAHPDFSYRGARAVIAVTGYDGLFGYRTNSEAERTFGTAVYEQEIESAKAVAQKLVSDGYELGCYTYENVGYGNMSVTQIEADMSGWTTEVISILPEVTIFAFAQNSDVGPEDAYYNDQRYSLLNDAGFNIFLGFSATGKTWSVISDSYVRQGRILLSPTAIAHHSSWFNNIFDAQQILDPNRGEIPV